MGRDVGGKGGAYFTSFWVRSRFLIIRSRRSKRVRLLVSSVVKLLRSDC